MNVRWWELSWGEEAGGREIPRLPNFPKGFCFEVLEIIVLVLSTPQEGVRLPGTYTKPVSPRRRPMSQSRRRRVARPCEQAARKRDEAEEELRCLP